MITPQKKEKIKQILNCSETGSAKGDYAKISIFSDGPIVNRKRVRQITYGKSQTTEYGKLGKLLKMYIAANGKFAAQLKPYLSRIGDLPQVGQGHLADDLVLLKTLKQAGADPIMITAQDTFFDIEYWKPAFDWFTIRQFTLPLSMLVIYDSFIQSGSILDFLRNRFPETTPSKGGDEKAWITAYTNTRHQWLSNNIRKDLRNSSYRTRDLLRAISASDWLLAEPYIANGVKLA